MKVLSTELSVSKDFVYTDKVNFESEIKLRLRQNLFHKFVNELPVSNACLVILTPVSKQSVDHWIDTHRQQLYILDMTEHKTAITSLNVPDMWIDSPSFLQESVSIKSERRIRFPNVSQLVLELKRIFTV